MSVKWKWTGSEVPDSTGHIDPPDLPLPRAMAANTRLRVFATCGYYDLVCDVAVNEWIVRQLPDSLRSRITVKGYHGGHAVYMDDKVRSELRRDVAAFLGTGNRSP
jgi:carboxypeptidase C (cathepsin A)